MFAGNVAIHSAKPNHPHRTRKQQLLKARSLALGLLVAHQEQCHLEGIKSRHNKIVNLVRPVIDRLLLRITLSRLIHIISRTVNNPLRDTNSSQDITLNPTPVMLSKTIRLISRIHNTRVLTEPLILIRLLAGTSNAQIVGH